MPSEERANLDKTIGRVAIPQVCDRELLALFDLPNLHGEQSDGTLLGASIINVKVGGVCINPDGSDGGRQEIE